MNWPPMEMFWERVRKEPNGCWTWTKGRRGPKTAPCPIIIYKTKSYNARRWAWTILRGTTTHPLQILCGNRMCVNPEHHKERGTTLLCKRGHVLHADNLYIVPKHLTRACRQCTRLRQSSDRQKALVRARNRRHYLTLTPEQKEKRRDATRRYARREAMMKRIDSDFCHWSDDAGRWLLWEGHRWITASDKTVRVPLGKYLVDLGVTPKGEDARELYINDIMRRMKKMRKPAEEAA